MNPHPLASFRFCPRCGASGFADHDTRSRRCPACGFVYYHNASASTVAVIFNPRGELLVTRRALEPARGTLDLPGGFVDPGESLDEGLLREVREETGAEAEIEEYLFSLPNTYTYSGFEVHTADAFFRCRLKAGEQPQAADDAAELLWLPAEEIRPEDFGLASIREGVRRILRSLPSEHPQKIGFTKK
ncbi:MAG TPA: NUDIX domain-containing protein [Alloprevotella sp.]|nr:NUDIX domain-containing protein [Alloprevotella sp.]